MVAEGVGTAVGRGQSGMAAEGVARGMDEGMVRGEAQPGRRCGVNNDMVQARYSAGKLQQQMRGRT